MKKAATLWLVMIGVSLLAQQESFHRADQDREISYWLLEPSTHQFRISHDFTVTRVGQKSVHSFVRKGSVVSPDAKMTDLDTGKPLKTSTVAGKDVNQSLRGKGRRAPAQPRDRRRLPRLHQAQLPHASWAGFLS